MFNTDFFGHAHRDVCLDNDLGPPPGIEVGGAMTHHDPGIYLQDMFISLLPWEVESLKPILAPAFGCCGETGNGVDEKNFLLRRPDHP
jgi:hypothetical protein